MLRITNELFFVNPGRVDFKFDHSLSASINI